VQISAAAAVSILWYDSPTGGNLVGAGNVFTTPVLTQTTTYYAQAGNVCIGQSRTMATATIYTLPTVSLGSDTSIVNPPYLLDAGSGFSTYFWSNNTSAQTLSVTSTGTYSVVVTDQNGCTATDDIFVEFTVGLQEPATASAFKVIPNPNNGRFILSGKETYSESILVRIFDAQGALVFQEMKENTGPLHLDFDLKGLARGVYTVRLSGSTLNKYFRFILE
jgi:hypothetical protein